jgi:hypothetical protein
MTLGEWSRDFPRHLAIDVSTDQVTWTTAWQGKPAATTMLAAIEHPLQSPLRIAFARQDARFVRFRLLADHKNLWRVAEIQVHSN